VDNQGVSMFTFSNNSYIEDRIDIGLVKKTIIYKDIKELNVDLIDDLKGHIKLSLEGELADIASFKKTKTYSELLRKNIKVVFRLKNVPKPDEVTLKPCSSNEVTSWDTPKAYNPQYKFLHVLSTLVLEEKDPDLIRDLELIQN
jgi:hypothetical protein